MRSTTFINKSIRKMYWRYYCQAKKRDLPFLISKELFTSLVTSSHCYYCKCEPYQTLYGFPVLGIDRVKNWIGYVEDNCVPCCKDCNFKKGRKLVSDFISTLK